MKRTTYLMILLTLPVEGVALAGWFGRAEDKIEIEVQKASQVGKYATFSLRVKNRSDKVVDMFAPMKVFGDNRVFLGSSNIQIRNLGPSKEAFDQVAISGVQVSDVRSWTFELGFPSSILDSEGKRIPDGEKKFEFVEVNHKNPSSLTSTSEASKCNVDAVKMSFVKSCTYAGQLQAESSGGRGNADKISAVCRCIAKGFNVEALSTLLQGGCEYTIPAVRGVMGMDKVRLQCGSP